MTIDTTSDLLKGRGAPTVWVTWLAKALADPAHCRLPAWALTRFSVTTDDSYSGDWAVKHAAIIGKVQQRLAAAGRSSEVEKDVTLISRTGLPIAGSIDVWAPQVDDSAAVAIDAKTGKHNPAHRLQVNLYQLITKATGEAVMPPRGMLSYQDRDVWINPAEASAELVSQVAELMEIIATDRQPAAAPSKSNCRFCSLKGICTAAWHGDSLPAPTTDLF
jgi:CRISPR/Cas system-associated exonuclease Cas4 (RecB family)